MVTLILAYVLITEPRLKNMHVDYRSSISTQAVEFTFKSMAECMPTVEYHKNRLVVTTHDMRYYQAYAKCTEETLEPVTFVDTTNLF